MSYRPGVTVLAVLAALLGPGKVEPLSAQTSCETTDAASIRVQGFVQEVESNLAIAGALVVARWSGGETETLSEAGGVFEFCDIPADQPVVLQVFVPPYRGPGVPLVPGLDVTGIMLPINFETGVVLPYTGGVIGRVVDAGTLEPIAGALVGNTNLSYTQVTDQDGRFVLTDLDPGPQSLRVQHIAYGERDNPIEIPLGTLELELRLTPIALAVEPLVIRILRVRSTKLERAGFFEREDWGTRLGLGFFITREEIEQRAPSRISHLLNELPRVGIVRGCSGPQCSVPFIRGTSGVCQELKDAGGELVIGASLYVDGHRTRMALGDLNSFALTGVDELMMPGDIAGIEVYSGYGDLPGEFADDNAQRCGAVVIWTGR